MIYGWLTTWLRGFESAYISWVHRKVAPRVISHSSGWAALICAMKSYTFLSLITVGLAPVADAFIRFPCSQLVTERFDPLVTPGQVSPHLHQIVGGVCDGHVNVSSLTHANERTCPPVSECVSCDSQSNPSRNRHPSLAST
ncbi:hypothetical protein FA13DRAFT_1521728 [Coprinellus micaceus]|uniref:Uncharacterized protein n=1 Tax=Coprinellus micaceus TaxID=71717 RepID=A0A4Y7SJW9_COPMI|nr:hypothetical protein FA13DRAFT_1521728 [Coprinellus micaceus]